MRGDVSPDDGRSLADGIEFVLVALEPELHVGGQLRVVEVAAVGVAQHGHRLVVARDDYEAFVLAAVEDVVEVEGVGGQAAHFAHVAARREAR